MGKKKNSYKYLGKSHPIKGVISTVIGVIAFLIAVISIYISSTAAGRGGILIGLGGVFALCITVCGFVFAIQSFKEKDIINIFPIIGLGLNGGLLVIYVVLYVIGLST